MSENDSFTEEETNLGHYEGDRNEKGERHGFGRAIFSNGDKYEGNYENGKRHGRGTYRFAKGSRYQGHYLWNHKEGFGSMIFPDGSKYDGNWSENHKQGRGVYHYTNGDTYDGEWYQDKKNGRGVYTSMDTGARTEGNWQNGKLHGPVKIDLGSHLFKGYYNDGVISGTGKFIFPKIQVELTGRYDITKELEDFIPEEGSAREEWRSKWKTHNMQPITNTNDLQ